MLDIYVGDKAKTIIEKNGFDQHLISLFLGASGGPKWFHLYSYTPTFIENHAKVSRLND